MLAVRKDKLFDHCTDCNYPTENVSYWPKFRFQVGVYTFSGMNTSVAYVFLICGHLSLSDISLRITINEFVPCILKIHCKYFCSLIGIFIYTDKYTNSLHRVFTRSFVLLVSFCKRINTTWKWKPLRNYLFVQ